LINAKELVKLSDDEIIRLIEKQPDNKILRDFERIDPIIWQMNNIRTEKGEKLEFINRPYLIQPMADFSEHLVFKKASQVGVTQLSIGKVLFVSDINKMTTIYTFPTAGDVTKFSKARFSAIVRDSKYLQTRIKDYDNATFKKIGDSTVYFQGTWVERAAISVPSDLNVHDELDFSKPGIRDVYSARLSVSTKGWEWDFSTPTIPSYGIDDLWKKSDKHVWKIKCTGCGKEQQIDFFKNMEIRKNRGGYRRYFFGCRRCHKRLDRSVGRWEALRPKKRIRGYYIPQTICGAVSPGWMMKEYRRLRKKPNGMKIFNNFNLGKAYDSGVDVITKGLIKSRIVSGTRQQGKICIGADQGDILHVLVSKLTDKRRIIFIGTMRDFDELRTLITHYSLTNPVICVVDALPNHRPAVDLANQMSQVFCAYYSGNSVEKGLDDAREKRNKEIHVPRTDVLDITASLWKSGESVIENYISIERIEEFASQMSNMKRDIVDDPRTGEQKPQWVKIGADHYRHADVYNFLASQLWKGRHGDLVVSSSPEVDISIRENVFSESDKW
jgi:hypothetical protein